MSNHAMGIVVRLPVVIALVALAAVVAAACGTTPSASSQPIATGEPASVLGPPQQASTRLNDVIVTLAIDHDRAPSGRELRARVEVQNVGFGPVSWQSGGCRLFNGLTLNGPDMPQPPAGRDWEGTAHWAKWSATTSGVGIMGFLPVDVAERGAPWQFGCPADLGVDDIGPGQTASLEAVWVGLASDGQPAPGGHYTLSYSFPFLARVAKEQYRGNFEDGQPIKATVEYDIDPVPGIAVPSTIAFDAALSDPRVAGWIQGITREQLYGGSVLLDHGLWQVRIEVENGAAQVAVDASSGFVVSVKLP